MQLGKLDQWLNGLLKEDDLLVGELKVPFLRQKEPIEICFVGQERMVTESQLDTLRGYLERLDAVHQQTLERIFTDYQAGADSYRKAFQEWGEDPDENVPLVRSVEGLAPLATVSEPIYPLLEGNRYLRYGLLGKVGGRTWCRDQV